MAKHNPIHRTHTADLVVLKIMEPFVLCLSNESCEVEREGSPRVWFGLAAYQPCCDLGQSLNPSKSARSRLLIHPYEEVLVRVGILCSDF